MHWPEVKLTVHTKKNDNPFAVVLIDGDGYIVSCLREILQFLRWLTQTSKFRDELLHEGAVGGAKAAQQLHDELQDYLRKFDGSKGWKLMVRIYVNLEGLKQTYVSRGLYAEEVTLREFANGFTQNQPLFDFVDVGYGKERADHKIKGVCHVSQSSLESPADRLAHLRAVQPLCER